MEFEKVVEERRSIRIFRPQRVEKDKIYKLIEMARLCQSAKNRQPWKFMIESLKGNLNNLEGLFVYLG